MPVELESEEGVALEFGVLSRTRKARTRVWVISGVQLGGSLELDLGDPSRMKDKDRTVGVGFGTGP